MKATGFVRRIDDLGRVVIPKEIRRHIDLYDGTPLEFFIDEIDEEPTLCLQKYRSSKNIVNEIDNLVNSLLSRKETAFFDRELDKRNTYAECIQLAQEMKKKLEQIQ